MSKVDPNWRPVAFKEWQLVAEAIGEGGQSVLLRKGGISEGKAGFQWLHEQFFLFPSFFHEQDDQVKTRLDGSKRNLAKEGWSDDHISFSVFVETVATGRITTWEEVQRLDPYHIWAENTVRERFDWGDEPGISYAVIRAFLLRDPWVLKNRKGFGGCRSWIGLPAEEGGNWREQLDNADQIELSCEYPEWLM
tara:strand:- start:1775 stop:2353 length:579 start_codon:yes stop_codon:yes gene_type:complete